VLSLSVYRLELTMINGAAGAGGAAPTGVAPSGAGTALPTGVAAGVLAGSGVAVGAAFAEGDAARVLVGLAVRAGAPDSFAAAWLTRSLASSPLAIPATATAIKSQTNPVAITATTRPPGGRINFRHRGRSTTHSPAAISQRLILDDIMCHRFYRRLSRCERWIAPERAV
jgi:hypothetical protein